MAALNCHSSKIDSWKSVQFIDNVASLDKDVLMLIALKMNNHLQRPFPVLLPPKLNMFLNMERHTAKDILAEFPMLMVYAPYDLRNDGEVVLVAMKKDWQAFGYASDELKNDREVVITAVHTNWNAIRYASDELKNDHEIAKSAVIQSWEALQYVSPEMKNERDLVLFGIRCYWRALQFASDRLKNDRDLVITAIDQTWLGFPHTSDELKNDGEVVLTAVIKSWQALKYASDELKNDRKVVLTAIDQSWQALRYASDELKNDREVVLTAVIKSWQALKYASDELKNDREIVMCAVEQNWEALQCNGLMIDKELCLSLVKKDWRALEHFRTQVEIIIEWDFKFIVVLLLTHLVHLTDWKLSKSLWRLVEAVCGCLLPSLRDIIEPAIATRRWDTTNDNARCSQLMRAAGITNNVALMSEAIQQDGKALLWGSDEIVDNLELVTSAVAQSWYALNYASERLRNDRKIVLLAVNHDGRALRFASDELKNDHEIVMIAVENDWRAHQFASPRFKFNQCDEYRFKVLSMMDSIFLYDDNIKGIKHTLHKNHEFIKTWRQYSLTLKDYHRTFLFGIHSTSGSKLSLLNKLGKYGLNDIKRKVADYAGLQYGSYYQLIAGALKLIGNKLGYNFPLRLLDDPDFKWTDELSV
jgi:hypothetical protein